MRYARRFGHNGGYGSAGYGAAPAGAGDPTETIAASKRAKAARNTAEYLTLTAWAKNSKAAITLLVKDLRARAAQASPAGAQVYESIASGQERLSSNDDAFAHTYIAMKAEAARVGHPFGVTAPVTPIVAPTTPALPMSTAPATQQVPVKPGPSLGSKYLSSLLDGSMHLPLPVVGSVQARLVAAPIAAFLLFKVLK